MMALMVEVKEAALKDVAKIIRSKNAGPFEVTLDVIFKNSEDYKMIKAKEILSKEFIAELYKLPVEDIIALVYFDAANAVKATIPRPRAQGSIGETDMHAAQHHAPLMDIMVYWEN